MKFAKTLKKLRRARPIDHSWAGVRRPGVEVGAGAPVVFAPLVELMGQQRAASLSVPAGLGPSPGRARPLRHSFSRLWVVPMRAASLELASSPRLLNRRKSCPSFTWPNTGSTSTPRFL